MVLLASNADRSKTRDDCFITEHRNGMFDPITVCSFVPLGC